MNRDASNFTISSYFNAQQASNIYEQNIHTQKGSILTQSELANLFIYMIIKACYLSVEKSLSRFHNIRKHYLSSLQCLLKKRDISRLGCALLCIVHQQGQASKVGGISKMCFIHSQWRYISTIRPLNRQSGVNEARECLSGLQLHSSSNGTSID